MEKEVDTLNEERKTIDRKLAMASKFNYTPVIETNKEDKADLEQRGKDLKEGRTITVATGNILLPTHQGQPSMVFHSTMFQPSLIRLAQSIFKVAKPTKRLM
jgi:putative ribosome biogenesis GTPase RsgA